MIVAKSRPSNSFTSVIRDARQPQRQSALKLANLSPQLTPLANKPICRSIRRRKNLKTRHFFDVRAFCCCRRTQNYRTCVSRSGVGQQRAEISRNYIFSKIDKKKNRSGMVAAGESAWLLLLSAQFSVVNSPKHCRKRKLRTFPPDFPPNHAFWWFGVSWHRSFPVSQLFYVNSFDSIIILNSMLWFMPRDPGGAGFRLDFSVFTCLCCWR